MLNKICYRNMDTYGYRQLYVDICLCQLPYYIARDREVVHNMKGK